MGRVKKKNKEKKNRWLTRELEVRYQSLERVAKALKAELADKEAKLQSAAQGEDGALIQRLKLKMRASYGQPEREMLVDFLRWLLDEQGMVFTEPLSGSDLEQMVAGIRIAPTRAVVAHEVVAEFLDNSREES